MADRVVAQGSDDIETILNSDIDAVLNQGKYQAGADKEEDGMAASTVWLEIAKVKEQVEQFVAMAEFNQKRAEQGGIVEDTTLHSLFLGNPGTGKTTVARILGNILFQKGVIKQKKFIEVSRSNLVGGYQGQTALKTREVLESALGGVLFIDEAYTLYTGLNDDFGKEALDEVLNLWRTTAAISLLSLLVTRKRCTTSCRSIQVYKAGSQLHLILKTTAR